jgi:hypothetical protein
MLTRMLVVIAFLACNSNAESLPSSSRQSWQDLEVITIDSQGKSAKTVLQLRSIARIADGDRENRT